MSKSKQIYKELHQLLRSIEALEEPIIGSKFILIRFFQLTDDNPYIANKIFSELPNEWRATCEKAARILATPRQFPVNQEWYGADIIEAELGSADDATSD